MKTHLLFLAALTAAAFAAEPISRTERAKMITAFEETVEEASSAIGKETGTALVREYSRRGDALLFLGKAKEAVADFEKMIEIDPSLDAPHWRLGIAYYFAGDFAKSAKQFEKYHTYNTVDRENGVWKFFAQAKVDGIEKARKEMIEYTRFDRHPFPAVYEMLAGKKTGAEVLAEMEKKEQKDDPLVMFFAHYYIGWNEQLHGRNDAAKEHLAKAVELSIKAGASGGPGYMGQVARLHYEALK
jgi:lipoprotein NlpI